MSDFFAQKATDIIKKRISVRTYSKEHDIKDKLDALSGFLRKKGGNPFGADVRLKLLECETSPRLGTYGTIKGAGTFIAGCVKKGGRDIEGFGFEFEKALLFATSLGLGTCWIGGFFTRGTFSAAMKPEEEWLPAVSPLGIPAEKRSVIDKAVAAGAGARSRKPFNELFFEDEWGRPLDAKEPLHTCLEMVRIAPSASNKQPWRAIKNDKGIHFFLKENKGYAGNAFFGFCIQRLDMGIAACHFSLAAQELGLGGKIAFEDPWLLTGEQIKEGLSYSFTWR